MPEPVRIQHKTDPKDDIYDEVGHLIQYFHPTGAQVLLVMYERAKRKGGGETRTQSGNLIIPETALGALAEDKWQGKVGLIVAMGPLAFKDDDAHHWGDKPPQIGDWAMIRVGDAYSFDLPGERRAREVEDVMIRLVLDQEALDLVY